MTAIPVPDPPLSDGLITLRRMTLDDVDAILEAVRDPLIPRYTRVPQPYQREHAVGWIEGHDDEFSEGTTAPFALAEATTGAFLGSIGLVDVDWLDQRAEVGYWTTPSARGRGATTRGVRLLSRWAIEVLGLRRLDLATHASNVGSQRVAERAGFTREGLLRSAVVLRDGDAVDRDDQVWFGLLADELDALTG